VKNKVQTFINNLSIKTKFLAILIFIIVAATSAVVFVRVMQVRDQQHALISERLQGNANLAVGIFDTVRGYTYRILDIVATMPYVHETLEGDEQAHENLKRRLLSLFFSINQAEGGVFPYANILVFDADYKLIFEAYPGGDSVDLLNEVFSENLRAARHGHQHVSPAAKDAESGRMHFLFTQPVIVNGIFMGITAILSNTEDLGVFLRDPTHDYDSFLNIADSEGTIFFSNRPAYIGRHVDDLGVFEAFGYIPMNTLFNHHSAITGIDKIAYITNDPGLGWTIVSFFDAAAVDSIAGVLFVSLFPTISGIILASILMMIIISRSLEPLKNLASAAGQISEGNLDVSFDVRQNDEIGRVSKSFLDIVETLNVLSDNFNKAKNSMTSGDVDYRLEDVRLGGIYNEMFNCTNDIFRHMQLATIQLKDALAKAEDATRAKSSFLATMSHEIRTPMNAILGIAQIQMQNEELPREYASEIEKIYTSGHNLLGIINDILDMSKIETGKMELNPVKYDVPSLINDAVQLNIVRIGSKPLEFILDIDENLPTKLIGDELRLKQILNNLLSNGIKYTEKGHVKLSFSHSEENGEIALYFSVEDTGQGMKLEDRDNFFSEYSRFNSEANRSTEGTGLGLSITKKLVDMMDGTIWVESEYGKGSVFMVMVKQGIVDCDVMGAGLVKQLSKFEFRGNRQYDNLQITREPMPYGKVLIVDDVETNLYVAKGLMKPYQLNIQTAISGFAALDLVKEGKIYDIIFMDHMMPQMDGIEATQKLRKMGYEGIIVALTANALAGNDEMFQENGFDSFISKPIDIRQLNNVLNKFVRDKQPKEVIEAARQQHKNKNEEIKVNQGADDELLAIFARDAKKVIPVISTAYENIEAISVEELILFVVNVHAMKSALANIGEQEASKLADILEEAGKAHDKTLIANETPVFIEKLQAIITRIDENSIDNDDTGTDSDPELLFEKLKLICEACEEYDDQAAEKTLAELKEMVWSKETKEFLGKINECILHSDFEEASKQIISLMKLS